MSAYLNQNSVPDRQKSKKSPQLETVNGWINFLSICEALDKRSASEKRLVEASGYQGHPLSTRMYINRKNAPILSPFVYIRPRALVIY